MKVKELIEKLKEFDGELEVKSKERYCEGLRPVSEVRKQYESLDSTYIYIG